MQVKRNPGTPPVVETPPDTYDITDLTLEEYTAVWDALHDMTYSRAGGHVTSKPAAARVLRYISTHEVRAGRLSL